MLVKINPKMNDKKTQDLISHFNNNKENSLNSNKGKINLINFANALKNNVNDTEYNITEKNNILNMLKDNDLLRFNKLNNEVNNELNEPNMTNTNNKKFLNVDENKNKISLDILNNINNDNKFSFINLINLIKNKSEMKLNNNNYNLSLENLKQFFFNNQNNIDLNNLVKVSGEGFVSNFQNVNKEKANNFLFSNNNNSNSKLGNDFSNAYECINNKNANSKIFINEGFELKKDFSINKNNYVNNLLDLNIKNNLSNQTINNNEGKYNNENNISSLDNSLNINEKNCDVKKVLKNYLSIRKHYNDMIINSIKSSEETKNLSQNQKITNNYSYVLNNYNLNFPSFDANSSNNNLIKQFQSNNINNINENIYKNNKKPKNFKLKKDLNFHSCKFEDKEKNTESNKFDNKVKFKENNEEKFYEAKQKEKTNGTNKSIYEEKDINDLISSNGFEDKIFSENSNKNISNRSYTNNINNKENRLRNFTCFNERIYEGGHNRNSKKLIDNYSQFYKKDLKSILQDPKHNFMYKHFSEMNEKIHNFDFNIHLLGKKRKKEKKINAAFIDSDNLPNNYNNEYNKNQTIYSKKDIRIFAKKEKDKTTENIQIPVNNLFLNNPNLNSPLKSSLNNNKNINLSKQSEVSLSNEFEIDIHSISSDSDIDKDKLIEKKSNNKEFIMENKDNQITNNIENNQITIVDYINTQDILYVNECNSKEPKEKKSKMVKIWDSSKIETEKVDNMLFKIEKIWPFDEFYWSQEYILEFLMENNYDIEKTKKYIMDRHNIFITFMSNKLIEKDNFSFNPPVRKPGIKKKKLKN